MPGFAAGSITALVGRAIQVISHSPQGHAHMGIASVAPTPGMVIDSGDFVLHVVAYCCVDARAG